MTHTRRAACRIVSLAAIACVLAGCTTFGGKQPVDVEIESNPGQARVYAIPHNVWVKHDGEKMLDDVGALRKYAVPGRTPTTDQLRPQRYIFVAMLDGRDPLISDVSIKADAAPKRIALDF